MTFYAMTFSLSLSLSLSQSLIYKTNRTLMKCKTTIWYLY